MKNIRKAEDLKEAIKELEAKKLITEEALKRQFHETVDDFKPVNILKNTVSEVTAAPQFKHNILNLVVGLGAGYLTRRIAVGKKAGLLAKTIGTVLQFGVTTLVAKNKANEEIAGEKKGGLLSRILSGSRK